MGSPSLNALFTAHAPLWDDIKAEATGHPYMERIGKLATDRPGMTPFQALYGRLPPTIPRYLIGTSPVHEVDQNLASRDEILCQLKINLHSAINRMKQVADSKRCNIEYQVGDLVFLRLHPYRQQTVFRRASQKLASPLYGPYPIEQRVGKVAYKLKLPDGSKIHPIFHVSLLKQKVGESNNATLDLPLTDDDGTIVLEPDVILNTRWVKKGSRFVEESLIKWKRLPVDDATWEETAVIQDRYLNMNLEDKVPVHNGGIDKPRPQPPQPRPQQPRRSQRIPRPN
ncbi:hypothetical protein F0562_026466 [Nyssa sinensis]|uniref:Uncharacterized protein n=1 Tax=Nyssa sinensis TaxID=561372 RepID=A0A5J5BAV1_9ASTE|nr:hypothetical protein F0562_026466 [Nyssa sinensis]